MLTNVTVYWLTRTAGSSARLYYETGHVSGCGRRRRRDRDSGLHGEGAVPADARAPQGVHRSAGERRRARRAVASDPARGRPLAIVIDGLDEAVGWSPGKLIPVRLPPRTFLVCSARAIADRDWVEELRLDEASVVQISLAPLAVADTGAMLRAAGSRAAELAGDPAFVGAVHGASGGEPSHLRFLAEDIEAGRVASVADVTKQPAGLRAYFDRWWRELAAEPLSGPVRDLLAYMHVTATTPMFTRPRSRRVCTFTRSARTDGPGGRWSAAGRWNCERMASQS
jgi:hypothetical protein